MPVLTPEEITNLYLYGTKSRPGDLLDERLIRASAEETHAAKAEASTEVDINDYMAEVGRFTSPADFEVINKFFASDDLPAGEYNEQRMRDLLNVKEKLIIQKQWAFSDDTDDYAARVYIWNSSAFEIDDRVRFIVEKDGSRRIENFAITPLNNGPENFDFESDDILASLGNSYLEEIVDPSGIGRKVTINFTGDRHLTTLDNEGYRQAIASKPSASLMPKLSILSEIQSLTDELFASGSTQALSDNKPIFYGSQQSDSMTGYDAKNEDLDDHRHLEDYADNGVAYVGGAGNDTIKGTRHDDILIGGQDDDILQGEAGHDIYIVDESDTILDSDHNGNIYLNNRLLTGGAREEGDPENTYYGGGNEYVLDGSTLTVNGSLTIRNYDKDKNSLNIVLSDEEPDDAPETGEAEKSISPIVIDMDGDGIETLKTGAAYFDFNSDALSEMTGWVSPDDGLLALDRNGDGRISNGRELFGNHTLLGNGKTADNGFLALAEYDDNSDKTIDAQDAAYATLQIWRDLNGNGASDKGELQSLADAGVAAISTDYKNSSRVDAHGHQHRQTAGVILSDGTTSSAADVWFKVDSARRINSGDIKLTIDSLFLANAKGFGKVHDLRQAIILDPGLKASLDHYTAAADGAERDALLDDLIYRWTGVADVDPHSRDSEVYGHQIDARQLVALEKLTGRPYVSKQRWGSSPSNPHLAAAPILKEEYQKFKRFTAAQLQAQTNYVDELDSIRSAFGSDAHSITVDWAALESKLQTLYAEGRVERIVGALAVLTDLGVYSPGYRNRRDAAFQAIGSTHPSLAPFFNNSVMLLGGANDDTLSGANTPSAFFGLDGNDRLQGQWKDDSYHVFRNQGDDAITDLGGSDQIVFGNGISRTDLTFSRDNFTVCIQVKNADGSDAGSVSIDNFFNADGSVATGAIERLHFIGGDSLNQQQMLEALNAAARSAGDDRAYGSDKDDVIDTLAGNDTIYGLDGDDRLSGGAGDDALYGGDGDDRLSGGAGDDTLYGGDGDDRLSGGAGDDTLSGNHGDDTLYGGDGDDSLSDDEGGNTLAGGAGNDMLAGTGVLDGGDGDDTLRGQGADTLLGGAGDDVLEAYSDPWRRNANTLAGGAGNDTLYGAFGDDTYVFNLGDGHDRLIERRPDEAYSNIDPSIDTLYFGGGISVDDLDFARYGDDLVVNHINGTDSVSVQNWFREPSDHFKLNHFSFADGSALSQAEVENLVIWRGGVGSDSFLGYRDRDDHIRLGDDDDLAWGRAGDDTIYGENGNDYLEGEAGNDRLYGGDGDDQLSGGAGDDVLTGGSGDDKYVYAPGEGVEIIDNRGGGFDGVFFIQGLDVDRLQFSRDGDDLLIRVDGDTAQSVRVLNHFQGGDAAISYVQPDEGYYLSAAEIAARLTPQAGSQSGGEPHESERPAQPTGKDNPDDAQETAPAAGDDLLNGTRGNDILLGGVGNDTLSGKAGNDMLIGGIGDDTYIHASGQDVLEETGGLDTLRFAGDITFDQVCSELLKSDNDLILRVSGRSDNQVILKDFFRASDNLVETIAFDTGGQVTAEQIFSAFGLPLPSSSAAAEPAPVGSPDDRAFDTTLAGRAESHAIFGSSGADRLDGGAGDDLLRGNGGDDYLIGGEGGDTYLFAAGDGQDVINNHADTEDTDILSIDGLNPSDLWLTRQGDDLVVDIIGSEERITIQEWYVSPSRQLDAIQTAGASLAAANVDNLVDAMAAFGAPQGGELPLTPEQRPRFEQMLAANWQ